MKNKKEKKIFPTTLLSMDQFLCEEKKKKMMGRRGEENKEK
jgi:hypothetical protein